MANGLPALPQIQSRGGNPCRDNRCSACCHDIEMLLTNDDLARLKLARPDMDFHFEADDGFLQLKTRDGPPATGGAGRPCVFLHADGSCSVHDIRPEGCRVYPAVWDESLRGAELDDMYCPHTDNFVLDDGVAGAAKRLAARLLAERRARRSGR